MRLTNENKHFGLIEKDLRDAISKMLKENNHYEPVEYLEERIRELNIRLAQARITDGLLEIMKQKKWKDYDVSEYVDYDNKTYFNFIGTEKEYNSLKLTKETKEEPVNKEKK
jgi:hypothetical protein